MMNPLTQRERIVLKQTVHGYSSTEIGGMLGISPKTVDTYRARLMRKLKLHHRSDLVHYALVEGYLKPPRIASVTATQIPAEN